MRKSQILFSFLAAYCSTAVAQPHLAFEVASVRPHQGPIRRSGPLTVSGPLIRLQGYTIFGLILDAYHLRDFQLSFGPKIRPEVIADDMYDIAARAPGDTIPRVEDVRAMLRTLLETRFGLRVHSEMRNMPVLALVTKPNQPGFRPADANQPCTIRTSLAPDGRNNAEEFSACSMERLADTLTHLVGDRPVVDRTGLAGLYDFRLVAVPTYRVAGHPEPADIDPSVAVATLGLRLVPQRAPVEVFVVDSVEKPGEN